MKQDSQPSGAAPQQSTADREFDKTIIDFKSPLHRQQASFYEDVKTEVDPSSPLHGGVTPALTESRSQASTVSALAQAADANDDNRTRTVSLLARAGAARFAPTLPATRIDPAGRVGVKERSAALPVGFRLFEYRIDGVLGQGGFGIAYRATDVNLRSKVVIKEYLPEDYAHRPVDSSVSPRSADDRETYQRGLENFLIEARTLATFRHPNIVRVARFFELHNTAYMVLEYERGRSLKADRAKRPAPNEREILTLLLPLLDGLSLVHHSGFLHRDIKPDNIYVRDEDGSLVLLDFGAARQLTGASADHCAVVTPCYGPIEQYMLNAEQGPYTDIYSLGATLYWWVTGRKPLEATDRMSDPDPMKSASELAAGRYSKEFLAAIDWALKPEAKDRPQDIAQFRTALYANQTASLGLEEALRASEGSAPTAQPEGWLATLASPRLLARKLARGARSTLHPGSWPIAVKMTLAMVLTALLPMVITAYYNLNGALANVASGELRSLEQIAQSTAGRISQLLGDSRNLASYLGTDPDFVEYLAAPNDAGRDLIRAKLDALVKANPDVQLVMVFDTSGTALVSSDPQVMGKNFKFREYFKAAMEGRSHITGVVVGAVAGQAGVFYSNPVRGTDAKVIGAVVLRIKAASIAAIVDSARGAAHQSPFLVDGDGVIVHHPDEAMMYRSLVPLAPEKLQAIVADQRFRRKTIESAELPELAQAMVGTKTTGNVSYRAGRTGIEEIAGYAPVAGHDWVVGVSETRESFAAPLNDLFRTVLYSVVVVGAIFLVLAMLIARSIVRPIESLNDAAHALKRGDYDAASVNAPSNDEIGQLARTFKVLVDVLRQREREQGRTRTMNRKPEKLAA